MTDMLIPNRPQKGKNIDEILANLPERNASEIPAPLQHSFWEFKLYEGDFFSATHYMALDKAFYVGAPRFINRRINAKNDEDPVWRYGCWTGEVTVTSADGMLVLPTKISGQYAERISLRRRQDEYLVLPQDEYEKLRDAKTDDVVKAINDDLPFFIPREKFHEWAGVHVLHESPLAVRACGGIEETKEYAACLNGFGIDVVNHYFAPEGFVLSKGNHVVDCLWVGPFSHGCGFSCKDGDLHGKMGWVGGLRNPAKESLVRGIVV